MCTINVGSSPDGGSKNSYFPILKNGNIANHKVDICGLLKIPLEFYYGGGARDPFWAPRLFIHESYASMYTTLLEIEN